MADSGGTAVRCGVVSIVSGPRRGERGHMHRSGEPSASRRVATSCSQKRCPIRPRTGILRLWVPSATEARIVAEFGPETRHIAGSPVAVGGHAVAHAGRCRRDAHRSHQPGVHHPLTGERTRFRTRDELRETSHGGSVRNTDEEFPLNLRKITLTSLDGSAACAELAAMPHATARKTLRERAMGITSQGMCCSLDSGILSAVE